MDKVDLDFLVDSEDIDLIYKHILEAICNSSCKIRDGINRYTIDQVSIHTLSTSIICSTKYDITIIRKVGKYALEL
jgi:hypothetical protein